MPADPLNNPSFRGRGWRGATLASGALALALLVGSRFRVPASNPTSRPRPTLATSAIAPALAPVELSSVSGTPEVAQAALDAITQIGGDRARQFLMQRFAEAADQELPQLARALAKLGGPEVEQMLMQATHADREAARSAARKALQGVDSDGVREFMLRELAGPDANQAAGYFADCQDPRAVPALERLARESGADLRAAAIQALFVQGPVADAAIARLAQSDDEVSNALLATPVHASSVRQVLRRTAVIRLRAGAFSSGPVFDFLAQDLTAEAREALIDSAHDATSRDSALGALSSRADAPSLTALSTLAADADHSLADRAACALASGPDSRSRPLLVRLARSGRPSEAHAALRRILAPEAANLGS